MNDGAGKLNMNFGASGLSTLKTEEEEAFLCLPAAIAIERARGAFRGEGGRLPAMTAEFSTTVEGVRQQWNWDGRTDWARGQRNNLADKNVNAKSRRPWKSLCGQSGGNWRYALTTDEEEMRCGGGGGRMDGVEKSVKNERTAAPPPPSSSSFRPSRHCLFNPPSLSPRSPSLAPISAVHHSRPKLLTQSQS